MKVGTLDDGAVKTMLFELLRRLRSWFGQAPSQERILAGEIIIENLPTHIGLMINLALLPVPSATSAAPYGGNPPGNAGLDLQSVVNEMDAIESLEVSRNAGTRRFLFELRRPEGHYYVQLRVIGFQMLEGQVAGQIESFFFGQRVYSLFEDLHGVDLLVTWPSLSPENLYHYGTVHPGGVII